MQLGSAVFPQVAADDHFNDHVTGMEIDHISDLTTNYQGIYGRIPYSENKDVCTMTRPDYCTYEHPIIPTCNDKTSLRAHNLNKI